MSERVAIITGASSGIGEVTARGLAKQGFTVYAAARRAERMVALKDVGIRPVTVDVTDDPSLVAFVDQVVAETGRVDVLVNNAGYGSYGALEDVPLEEARRQVEVNLFGLARLTQLVLPHMRAQGSGRIVNISSMGGKIYEPLGSWYHATKFAVEGLSDSLRLELAQFGIKVVVIEPGDIKTEWGSIAAESMLATSGGTVYADQAAHMSTLLTSETGSSPDVVAKAVLRAATSSRPRTRYAVGRGAKALLYSRRVLTDRGFDRLLMGVFRAAK